MRKFLVQASHTLHVGRFNLRQHERILHSWKLTIHDIFDFCGIMVDFYLHTWTHSPGTGQVGEMSWTALHSLVFAFLLSTGKLFRSGSKTVKSPMWKVWQASCPPKLSVVDLHGLWCFLHAHHEFHESFISHEDQSFHSEGRQTVIPQYFSFCDLLVEHMKHRPYLPRWVERGWSKCQQCEAFGKHSFGSRSWVRCKVTGCKVFVRCVRGRWYIDPKV